MRPIKSTISNPSRTGSQYSRRTILQATQEEDNPSQGFIPESNGVSVWPLERRRCINVEHESISNRAHRHHPTQPHYTFTKLCISAVGLYRDRKHKTRLR